MCGPLLFLADIASKLNISTVIDSWDLGFGTHLNLVRIEFILKRNEEKQFRRAKWTRFSSCKLS